MLKDVIKELKIEKKFFRIDEEDVAKGTIQVFSNGKLVQEYPGTAEKAKELKIKLRKESDLYDVFFTEKKKPLKEAWVSDVQGKRSGQEKASEREWVTKAGDRRLLGYKLSVRRGTNSVVLDKIYPSKEEAMQHAKILKLPLGTTSTVPVYE